MSTFHYLRNIHKVPQCAVTATGEVNQPSSVLSGLSPNSPHPEVSLQTIMLHPISTPLGDGSNILLDDSPPPVIYNRVNYRGLQTDA